MIDGSVQSIRAVYDYALQILTYEITARCFSISSGAWCVVGVTFRLTTSFKSVSYNNVPTVIMELMKDMKGFSDIVIKIVRVWCCDEG